MLDVYFIRIVHHMFKSKEKEMGLPSKKEPFVETLRVYSAKQLQFAIRLGMLPTPDKLNGILRKGSQSENEIKYLAIKL